MRKEFRIVGLFLALAVTGCGTRKAPASGMALKPAGDTISVNRVVPINQEGLHSLVQQKRGKILFLNLWATWCAPCVEEFPDLVKLSSAFDTSDVEVVGISADYPDEIESKIQPFIEKHHVPFRMYVAEFEHQEDFINAVDTTWSGALPVSMVFDRSGKRTFFHVGQGTLEQFMAEIQKAQRD